MLDTSETPHAHDRQTHVSEKLLFRSHQGRHRRPPVSPYRGRAQSETVFQCCAGERDQTQGELTGTNGEQRASGQERGGSGLSEVRDAAEVAQSRHRESREARRGDGRSNGSYVLAAVRSVQHQVREGPSRVCKTIRQLTWLVKSWNDVISNCDKLSSHVNERKVYLLIPQFSLQILM